jgi:hypothetical protein
MLHDEVMPEVTVDKARRRGKGKPTTVCYLSPPLASAVRRLAAKQGCSQSHLVRDLLRNALRARGLLPNKSWGSIDAAAGHVVDDVADHAQA